MKLLTSLAGGLAGTLSVTILHRLLRKIDPSVPRPAPMGAQGLNGNHSRLTNKHRLLMVGLSVAGGLIAAGVTNWLDSKTTKKPAVARIKAPGEAYKPILDITV
ncbi:hypothetical protein D3H65_23105 [Paraflavitalea soli]|uniref:Uncharacterized protein n=1 Tax=Paraflavitalea soli TaxID=2315862 RepID=A0A3B7MQ88_9BACT|nr:hypothetical protein [Paraflavitalea soli]AXY76704.1 hypothetical protein D3H65_23105 [Paraflavitalea soli]